MARVVCRETPTTVDLYLLCQYLLAHAAPLAEQNGLSLSHLSSAIGIRSVRHLESSPYALSAAKYLIFPRPFFINKKYDQSEFPSQPSNHA